MTTFGSLFSSKLLTPSSARERPADGLARLRFALETLPGARKYIFTAATRAEVLSELYEAFWGPYAHLFLPSSNTSLPQHALLSEVQLRTGFSGAGGDDPVVPGRSCGHIFVKNEACYRCKDCATDDSCVMCSKCFRATRHEGHNVTFYIAQQPGGCCDCGDPEAWRRPNECKYHPPPTGLAARSTSNSSPSSTGPPRTASRSLVLDMLPHPGRVSYPPELRETMGRTIAYALDYVLDTLDYSPDEASIPSRTDGPAAIRSQPSADPLEKELFAVIVWNDEKHAHDEVVSHVGEATSRSDADSREIARRIDREGRAIVEMGADVSRLLDTAHTVAQIDLGVTVRRAYDAFREQVAQVIIEWLLDLCRSRLGTDTLVLRDVIASELLAPRKRDSSSLTSNQEATKVYAEIKDPARLDWMLLYHTRLWKRPRLSLKELYVSVLTLSHAHKVAVAVHFANVYHRVIDSYLLVDREAETSIKYFALQLFTVPSIASHIVRQHSIITRLLAIITAFFTNQIAHKRITFPPDPRVQIDVDAFPFKSKRFMPVFSDLRYICHNDSVQHLIAHNLDYIVQFSKVCQLFMGINPNKRAVTSHVEYETDAWINVFNVTLSLSRVIKVYGEAYSRSSVGELVAAISTVINQILMVCTLSEDRLDRTKYERINYHFVHFSGRKFRTVQFDVASGWTSFHHSLHWLLSELLKHVNLLHPTSLSTVDFRDLHDLFTRGLNEQAVLAIIDFPLRVLVMIAQIRASLWVRNGFAVRGQLLHYRDFMLRELCYDQDLYIIQCAFIILDPATVLTSILDRFQLIEWMSGIMEHPVYDQSQVTTMVEEMLYIVIFALSENANALRFPMRRAVRREIIHALALGPCTFTELVKRVAERMADDVCFDAVLKEVATFRPPETVADTGSYELKDEAYEEINPFFYHYSRNKREEVEATLRARHKRQTGSDEDFVLPPKSAQFADGMFGSLPNVFLSEALQQILFYAIRNTIDITESVDSAPPATEAILDQALHLVMLGLVELGPSFSAVSSQLMFENGETILAVLCDLEHHEKLKAFKARTDWILQKYLQFVPEELKRCRRTPMPEASEKADPDRAKKLAAKARKDAIMKQFQAAQQTFMTNFEDIDDEDDEDSMDVDKPVSYGTCIVCQEELNDEKTFGVFGLIQPSRLIRRSPDANIPYLNDALHAPMNLDTSASLPRESFPPQKADIRDASQMRPSLNLDGFPNQSTRFGLHGSICSHMMHLECFSNYSATVRQRHRSHSQRNHPENIARKEFICPLCKSLGNVIMPLALPASVQVNALTLPDWIRSAGIGILRSKPDPQVELLQIKNGTGEFSFWAAQDPSYTSFQRAMEKVESLEAHKMVDTVVVAARSVSQQTRHLRDRLEPEPGERGAGMYLPEDLVGYTIAAFEISERCAEGSNALCLTESMSTTKLGAIRCLISCLTRLASLPFKNRFDKGRDAIRQAIVKRIIPEFTRTPMTPFQYPLLLRDPLTLLIETAAIAPDLLRHVVVLSYYVTLARTVIGLVFLLNKARSFESSSIANRKHIELFGELRIFWMSVSRHSPVFEHTALLVFDTFGEARIEQLMYAFTLPFLRRAAILCRAMLPDAFPVLSQPTTGNEYQRLLKMLGIPALSELPGNETLQNALAGWCTHFGQVHAGSQLRCNVGLDYPAPYRIVRLPLALDNLFGDDDSWLLCTRCSTVPDEPAICLLCGTICCMQSWCCQDVDSHQKFRGECNMHTRECGGAVGLFYLVKRSCILYLYGGNGSFATSPYLDIHGEPDPNMRRGRRQFLHHVRWEEVRKMWLNHGIPTYIARRLESSADTGGWETL